MPLTREQGIRRLLEVVKKDIRHTYYQRTVDKADLYRKLVTGEGMETLLKRFAKRESEELFKQRKEITQHVIRSVVKNLMDVFYKVPRSNYQRILTYQSANDQSSQATELENVLAKFWGTESLDDYLSTRFIELNAVDPNAFVVLEFASTDGLTERVQPYPFEVASKDAVDFLYENHILQYLIVRTPLKRTLDSGKEFDGNRFTLYLPDETLLLEQVPDDTQTPFANEGEFAISGDGVYVVLNKHKYKFHEFTPHNAGRVLAFRVGYTRDLFTDGKTMLSPYDAAVPYLMKSIKVNSELDLTMALVAFPLTIRYVDACDAQGCMGGSLPDGSTCQTCSGTGKRRPTSVQEEITLVTPRTPEEMVNPDNLISFKSPPVDIIQFQSEYIDSLTAKAKSIVFNSDIFDKQEISETATGKNIDLQNVYDTLYPLARKYSRTWEFCVNMIANLTDLDKGLIACLKFSKDFKLKSMEDLMYDLQRASESGAGAEIRRNIQQDMVRLLYAEDNLSYQRWVTMDAFNPFAGMREGEILTVLNSDFTPRRNKVLYANMGMIFDELELEYADKEGGFYMLNRSKQRDAIFQKVESLMRETEAVQPSLLNEN